MAFWIFPVKTEIFVWFHSLMNTRATCVSQLTPSVFEGLRSWQRQNRLKQAVLQLLAKELNESDIIQLRKKFEAFDRKGNGTITLDELKRSGADSSPTKQVALFYKPSETQHVDIWCTFACMCVEKSRNVFLRIYTFTSIAIVAALFMDFSVSYPAFRYA